MVRAIAALLLASSLSLPFAALADSIADEADFRFRRAAQLYKKGEVDEALSEFLASNRLVRNRNVVFNIARCFEQLKMLNEAYRWYVELLSEEMPEADRHAVQMALTRLRPHLALLEIASEPPGATVYVDRKNLGARGQTPLTLALPPGTVTAILELDGFRALTTEAGLTAGKTAHVTLPLERIWGRIEVEGTPASYQLKLDRTDSEPVAIENGAGKVLPGDHLVFLSAEGYLPEQLSIHVPPDGTAKVQFKLARLRKPTGRVVARASVDGALVRIDGKEMGFTPGVIESVETGEHQLEISAEGREPFRRRITVVAGQRTFVDAKLQYVQARVVAAQRQLTTLQDAPASVTVIEGDELRAFGYLTLAEALRSVRGLYTSNDRDYESLGVRGFSTPGTYNNRVLVLFDGHVTNDVALGQGFIGRDFAPELADVERIEIVRGPGSVLYGSAAFFAVVNVVHKTPPPGSHAEVGGALGTFGEDTGYAQASTAGAAGSLTLHASGMRASGEPVFVSPAAAGLFSGDARDVDLENALHADLRGKLGDDLTLLASINRRRKDIPTAPFNTIFGQQGTWTRDLRGFAELSYSHTMTSGLGVDARASYDAIRYYGNWQYRGSDLSNQPGNDTNNSDWLEAELRVRLPDFGGNKAFIGFDGQYRTRLSLSSLNPDPNPALSTSFYKKGDERIASVYLGDDYRISRRVTLSLAARLDDYPDTFGAEVNPRLALLLVPYEDGHTKLLFGRAFRAPSFYERFFNDGGVSQTAAGPLQPERISTAELEHTHQLNDEVSLALTGYWSRMENLIVPVTIRDAGVIQFQNNPGLVHSAGVEAEGRWRPGRGALFSLWYAFNRTADSTGAILPNSPQHSGAVRLLYPVVPEIISFATELIYGSPRHTVVDDRNPDTLVGESLHWNLGLSGEYARWRIRYGAHIYNLLDQRPSLPAGPEIAFPGHAVPQYGRSLRLSLSVTF